LKQGPWAAVDWTNFFLPARVQGVCGSCWAFSISGVLEATLAIKVGIKQYLSPQWLLNCDNLDAGCGGGAFVNTFTWIKGNGTIPESALPYAGVAGTCNMNLSNSVTAQPTGFQFCASASQSNPCSESLIYSFLQQGPVNVGIDASSADFQAYASGVYTGACTAASNHAVILAGYGLDSATQKEYWLIRNSWGVSWGHNGYIKIARNATNNNSCFTMSEAWIPTF